MTEEQKEGPKEGYKEVHTATIHRRNSIEEVENSVVGALVESFSLAKDHKIRGKWRYCFCCSILFFPLILFAVLLWYFTTKLCTPLSSAWGVGSINQLNDFLGEDGIHFCASAFSDPPFVACLIDTSGPYSTYNFDGACSTFKPVFAGTSNFANCFGQGFTILYTQCVDTQTALVNAIQYALYLAFVIANVYLAIRVVKRFGFCGLFSGDNWRAILFNDTYMKKSDAELHEVV
jgi:hypothetical protein